MARREDAAGALHNGVAGQRSDHGVSCARQGRCAIGAVGAVGPSSRGATRTPPRLCPADRRGAADRRGCAGLLRRLRRAGDPGARTRLGDASGQARLRRAGRGASPRPHGGRPRRRRRRAAPAPRRHGPARAQRQRHRALPRPRRGGRRLRAAAGRHVLRGRAACPGRGGHAAAHPRRRLSLFLAQLPAAPLARLGRARPRPRRAPGGRAAAADGAGAGRGRDRGLLRRRTLGQPCRGAGCRALRPVHRRHLARPSREGARLRRGLRGTGAGSRDRRERRRDRRAALAGRSGDRAAAAALLGERVFPDLAPASIAAALAGATGSPALAFDAEAPPDPATAARWFEEMRRWDHLPEGAAQGDALACWRPDLWRSAAERLAAAGPILSPAQEPLA